MAAAGTACSSVLTDDAPNRGHVMGLPPHRLPYKMGLQPGRANPDQQKGPGAGIFTVRLLFLLCGN